MCHLVPHCLVLPEIGGGHQQDGLIHQSETVMLVDIILRTQFVTCSDAHRFRPLSKTTLLVTAVTADGLG